LPIYGIEGEQISEALSAQYYKIKDFNVCEIEDKHEYFGFFLFPDLAF
jgi:hypothetical protein